MISRTTMLATALVMMVIGTAASRAVAATDVQVAKVAAKIAAHDARQAGRALAKRRTGEAVTLAEHAVSLAPRATPYRMLMGEAYLQEGRFASAAATFADVLSLDPANARAALNLSLAQIATGDRRGALITLEVHAGRLRPADRGLAMALAGEPAAAVPLLMEAARAKGADPTVRQNLALALALAGQWQGARIVAGSDLSPALLETRMQQWAVFAGARGPADQVAALLGVAPAAADPGLPVALALSTPTVSPMAAVAASAPVPAQPAPVMVAATSKPAVVFGPLREVVQSLPAVAAARRAARPSPVPSQPGDWFVQIGAYESSEVAHDAWDALSRRGAAVTRRAPLSAEYRAGDTSYYRLSVGAMARGEADALCRRHRGQGGRCFVRGGMGERVAVWARPEGVRLASR